MTITPKSFVKALLPLMLVPGLSACTQETPDMQAVAVVPAQELVLTGELYYNERIALSAESRARIILSDISIADRKAPIIAEKIIDLEGQQVPITFKFEPKTTKFEQMKTYSVRATLIAPDDSLLWTTDQAYMVNPFAGTQKLGKMKLVRVEPRPSERPVVIKADTLYYQCGLNGGKAKVKMGDKSVELSHEGETYTLPRVISASGAKYEKGERNDRVLFWLHGDEAIIEKGTGSPIECERIDLEDTVEATPILTGGVWNVEKFRDEPSLSGTDITLTFVENFLSGSTGCNRFTAEYKILNDGLKITPMGMTKKMCSTELMAQEALFTKFLQKVETYKIREDGTLVIKASSGHDLIARRE